METPDENPQKSSTTRRARAMECLLNGGTKLEAAVASGVSQDTLTRWTRDPEFVAAIRAAETEALSGVSRGLARLGEKAITTLETVMDSPTAADSVKVRAADTTLARLIPIRELVAVESRLSEIEARLAMVYKGNNDET